MNELTDIAREELERQIQEQLKGLSDQEGIELLNYMGDYILDTLSDKYIDYPEAGK